MNFSVYQEGGEQRSNIKKRKLLQQPAMIFILPHRFHQDRAEPWRKFENFQMKFDETCGK